MAKTWKDQPKDVSGYKPFRKRKKPLSDKLKVPEAEMLEAVTNWDEFRDMFKDGYAED